MDEKFIFTAGSTLACRYAASYLKDLGLQITDSFRSDIRYLLLDTPSFDANGNLRGGSSPVTLLESLPKDVHICGGKLDHPVLDKYEKVDFLKDDTYLCENAYITAECALDVAMPYLKRTLRHCPVLILGWGRIGKCLARLLRNLDAEVTIAARNPKDIAMIHAIGFSAVAIKDVPLYLEHFQLIYNTVPAPVLTEHHMTACRHDCVKIELASTDGMAGEDIVIARGLPGIHMPESSGKLIAETFLRLCCRR